MNDFNAEAALREVADGSIDAGLVFSAHARKSMDSAYAAYAAVLQVLGTLASRLGALVGYDAGLPLIIGHLTGERLISVAVRFSADQALDWTEPADPAQPAATRTKLEMAAALQRRVHNAIDETRSLLRDVQAGKDVLSLLARMRRSSGSAAYRSLLELGRGADIVMIDGRTPVGGLTSAPPEVGFTQTLNCVEVIEMHGVDSFVVSGTWSSVAHSRGDRAINSGTAKSKVVRTQRACHADLLRAAYRTHTQITLRLRVTWPLGIGKDKYVVESLTTPESFPDSVRVWTEAYLSGKDFCGRAKVLF